ncbi:response regulator [uncultured Sphingomonas sp.]|uniref:response regulator n=1 Tax=uncultured Sphingomonas sp. TaxID=158754 RepID=UPI0035CA947E
MTLLLLVDDEALILHLVNDALEDGGFSTFQAMTGAEAIEALNDPQHEFAGLITDVNIGDGVTGWDVARVARHRSAEMPVVYMTGDSAHDWSAEGVPNSLLVQKPFAVAQITTAISQLITEAATRHASTGGPDPFSPAAN